MLNKTPKLFPHFVGVSCGFELATSYPFGFFQGSGYDLEVKAKERFVTRTERLRTRANELGLYLCHEINPISAAMCIDDFTGIVDACDSDHCLGLTADPSHCWESEDMVYAAAVKNFVIHKNRSLRKMQGD